MRHFFTATHPIAGLALGMAARATMTLLVAHPSLSHAHAPHYRRAAVAAELLSVIAMGAQLHLRTALLAVEKPIEIADR